MASIHSRYCDTGRRFIRLDRRPPYPAVAAVLLGGSRIYSAGNRPDEEHASDWDGAIIVSTKLEILQLVNEQRPSLMGMLGIVKEECPALRVPDPSSPLWNDFDCIRVAGFDRLGVKRSVKVLSLDCFSEPRDSLRILSFKDKRVFETFNPPAKRFYLVQQATRLEDGLFILHDQWIYTAPASTCVHGQNVPFTAFGVTADLLVSGFWLHGHEPHGHLIQSHLLLKYSSFSGRHANNQSFAKYHRFLSEHRNWLAGELSDLYLRLNIPPERPSCHCSFTERTFLCGEAYTAPGSPFMSFLAQSTSLSLQAVEYFNRTDTLSLQQRPPSAFASNSTAIECTIPAGTLEEMATKLFCKRSPYPQQEVQGALNAAGFGLRVQIPHVTSSGELLYPFFEGKTQSELRLSLHSSGRSHWHEAEILLYTELVKAEGMLRLYSKCFINHEMPKPEATAQPIHRFFHLRLAEDARFLQFYGDSCPIGGKNLTMADFLRVSWKVNGITYPPLNELFRSHP